ncbi:MAG: ABC transporter ATP-binding protein [Acidimicrobiia bacterium]|nr:ABC transporter ATP-binding protein [Acidimicrobiia bacterium]
MKEVPVTETQIPAASALGVTKVFGFGETAVTALDDVSVSFEQGKFSAIMGPSGSGKSTLLHCLAGLDRVTDGQVLIGDVDLTGLNDKRLTQLRRDKIGFVFQAFNLVPTLNARENITLPMDIAGRKPDAEWLNHVIEILTLGDRLTHKPTELSGGQQQRVAAARALAGRPEIIFADEPSGNLDSKSGTQLLRFMKQAVEDYGQTIVMVTHDPLAAAHSERVVFLEDGKIAGDMLDPTAERILDRIKTLEG